MTRSFITILSICTFFLFGCGNKSNVSTLDKEGNLNWLTVEEADKLQGKDKLFLVDVYTDWCGWCKVMDKKTFTDQKVKDYLNEHFYVVKFNAEQKDPVTFKGTTYEWKPGGRKGVNGLAPVLLNGRLGYPSFAYLDKDLNPIKVLPGYKTPEQLIGELEAIVAGK